MDIFVTGASGYIGSALTRVLVVRGHRVRGLARSAAAAATVRAAGGEPVHGDLTDVDVLAAAAGAGDAVVHTAATTGEDRAAVDAAAVTAMLAAMPGRTFVTTTGAPRARSSREPVTEDDTAEVAGPLAWLAAAEERVLSKGGAVLRPPIVYGDGGGPVAALVGQAREQDAARYAGDGANVWSTVHVVDLAVAYATVLETGATGVFHAAEGRPEPMRDIMTAVGEAAGVRVLQAQAGTTGYLAMDAALDAGRLRGLGWRPRFGAALGGIAGALRNPAQGYTVSA